MPHEAVRLLEQLLGLSRAHRARAQGLNYDRVAVSRLDGLEEASLLRRQRPRLRADARDRGPAADSVHGDPRISGGALASPPLLPAAPEARARVRALMALVACDIQPLNNQRVQDALLYGIRLRSPHPATLVRALDL